MVEQPPHGNLFTDLARRGVYQAVGIYVAVAWGSIEILITVADRFGWPAWLGDAALILFLTGLPFVVLLAWSFDLTGHGLQRVELGSLKGKSLIAGGLTVVLAASATLFVLRDDPSLQKASASTRTTVAADLGQPAIAVLPFDQYLGSAQGELLARSFTDEVINRINRHPDLVALDWNTVSSPLMTGLIQSAEANASNVNFLVRGSLRPAPVGVELRVRMTDPGGAVLWEMEEVRALDDPKEARLAQQFVAGKIAAGVGTSLTGFDYCELSDNPDAVALYYEALDLFALRGEHVATAAIKLEEAIELDPNFARAMDQLSAVYSRFQQHVLDQPQHYRGMTRDELIQWWERESPVATVSRSALDRCPSLGGAYVRLEISAPVRHTLADEFEINMEGLRRDPGNVNLLDRRIYLAMFHGQLEHAHDNAQRFHAHSPLSPRANRLLSVTERLRGNHRRSLELMRNAVEYGYEPFQAYHHLAYLLMVLGEREELVKHLGPDFQVNMSNEPNTLYYDPVAFLDSKKDPALRKQLTSQLAEMVEQIPATNIANGFIGWNGFNPVLLEFGDRDLAWKALERVATKATFAKPEGIWDHRYRSWFGPQILRFDLWISGNEVVPGYAEFWDRHGPPDGCTWDGQRLACEWAEEPAATTEP
jgi:TolB-like protein/tetratricopeptide (TPR) repeat protein